MIEVKKIKNKFFLEENDFQSLNSKSFGNKIASKFELNEYEVAFLIEKKKIKVFEKNSEFRIEDIMNKKEFDYNYYLVFKDLRTRGYIVKSGLKYGFVFRVYDKGIKLGDDHSLWLVDVYAESNKIKLKDLSGKNRVSHTAKKKMLIGIVDDEGDVTYIENNWKRV